MFGGKRPDITPAQIVSALTWIVAQAVAFGVLDTQKSQVILSAGTTVIVAGWQIADAILRAARNKAIAAPPPTV
jgi:hypothetical protein